MEVGHNKSDYGALHRWEFRGAVIFHVESDINFFENCHLKVIQENMSNQFADFELISFRDLKLNFLLMAFH
jgi:hypothetical protein